MALGFSAKKLAMASLILGVLLTLTLFSTQARGEPLQFFSTQHTRLPEADAMREILKNFPKEVNFRPNDDRQVFELLMEQCTKGSNRIDLIGTLHGDFSALAKLGYLRKVDDILTRLKGPEFVEDFVKFGKLGRQNQAFIPWMQATYIMVANRRALKYLPKGAELNHLSYDQLKAWAANIKNATGEAKLGFPVEPDNGLMHRFLQGYLYPSFTGSTLRKFRSPEAETMWREFRDLWWYVNPRSLTFSEMDSPLLAGEVWVAWDHTARMRRAFQQQPKEFIAFPPPSGLKGRGFMTVLAGVGIPKCAPDTRASGELIEFLTRPEVQLDILRKLFFFPEVDIGDKEGLSPGLDQLNEAVTYQSTTKDGIKTLLPVGLGEKSHEFDTAYKRTFSQIVLRGRDIKSVLAKQTKILRRILSETEAPCWPPDEPSRGPCPVE
jgi:multiple sugar transport system substrate-binding protein